MILRWCATIALAASASSLLSDVAALQLASPGMASRAAIVLAGYPAGVLLGCLGSARVLGLLGHRSAFALLSGLGALAALAGGAGGPAPAQLLARVLSGACMGGLYVAVESNPIPVKAALAHLGLCTDAMRLPLVAASEGTRARLSEMLSRLEDLV